MMTVEKDRIQTEVKEKMSDMKAYHASETSVVEAKTSFLSKFLAPFDLRQKTGKIKVLVCEDCSLWTKLLKNYLERAEAEVTTSLSPVYFLNKKSLESFDLIITDNQMPYMYGTQFVEYIEKELQLDIPIYIHSADSSLKENLPLSKVLRGIHEKGASLAPTIKAILDDFRVFQENQRSKMELKYAITANTLIA